MIFDQRAVAAISLMVLSMTWNAHGFTPLRSVALVAGPGKSISSTSSQGIVTWNDQQSKRTRLFMGDDEDEDEDDEDNDDPLGEGIDSVSWLPTVIGAKGRLTTSSASSLSVREVSRGFFFMWQLPRPFLYLIIFVSLFLLWC